MPPAAQNIEIPRFTDQTFPFLQSGQGAASGINFASGLPLQFTLQKHFGGSGLISKSCASGFNGSSGIGFTTSGLDVRINAGDTSGMQTGNYIYDIAGTLSGSIVRYWTGFVTILPSTASEG